VPTVGTQIAGTHDQRRNLSDQRPFHPGGRPAEVRGDLPGLGLALGLGLTGKLAHAAPPALRRRHDAVCVRSLFHVRSAHGTAQICTLAARMLPETGNVNSIL
jgi:hypothetical protein